MVTGEAGNRGESNSVEIPVVRDPGMTVRGRIADDSGRAVEGARVEVFSSGLTAEFFAFDQPLIALPALDGREPVRTSTVSADNLRNPRRDFGMDPFGAKLFDGVAFTRFNGTPVRIIRNGEVS